MNETARSYCTGYGGLEMSVRAAFGDFTVLSHSDIKPAAVALLDHHHPDVPNLGDMRAIDYSAVEPVDLLVGSWPCQPHSAAGKRLGEADPRDLWPEYLRAIKASRPAIFFGENVARISSNGELRRVARSLAEIGYVGAWRSFRASDVGACHQRDRMFVVAVAPNSEGIGRLEGWAESTRVERGQDAALAGAAVRDLSLLPTPTQRLGTTGHTSPAVAARRAVERGTAYGKNLDDAIALLPTPSASASAYGTNQGGAAGRAGVVRESLDTMARHGRFERWGKYAAAIARHEHALGRPAPEPTAGVTRAGNPQLNPEFVEWMIMLPEGWVCDIPDLTRNQKLSLLGDGVCPPQGAAAFRFLLGHLADRLVSAVAA